MRSQLALITTLLFPALVNSQDFRWQQRVDYTMKVALNTSTHILTGDQKLVYTNNSPDTLRKVYYHLYFNAFQPGSMMDVRSRNVQDPDKRIGDRISKLQKDEIGYQKITSLKQDGKPLTTKESGTILEVALATALLPGGRTTFDMTFEAQVPIQVRRSGRNNSEGISYSMTQWYPKIAEYDHQGWHAYQYVAREFHSVWGDFDVSITLDPTFTVAATGILQNPEKIGHGYAPGVQPQTGESPATWRFVANNVIDFAWAADPDYAHDQVKVPGGPVLHFFYQDNSKTKTTWKAMQPIGVKVFEFLNKTFGQYPFETYSIIQGGDGGMEYPMCTLIMGEGKLEGVVGTMAHEVAHSWYQMALASNEALYAWMDEGFTDFASDEALAYITQTPNDHIDSYKNYFTMINNGMLEAPSQHADHYATNKGYRTASYTTGAVFLHQLKYIVGEKAFYAGMKQYYNTWKFRHPEPNDFIRVMEKASGMQLGWYLRYFTFTTRTIDYGVTSVEPSGNALSVSMRRIGAFPMPIDLVVTYKDGSKQTIYIPTNETLGSKPAEDPLQKRTELKPWAWVDPNYTVSIDAKPGDVVSLEIDPSMRMADVDRSNNKIVVAGAPKDGGR
jgi:hypothetical protein